jgi:GPH family glycoside/pentoside/hexuronide:cation symporter
MQDAAAFGETAGKADASRTAPLSFRTKTIYGSGALVENVINTVLSNFHMIYMTAVCGMSGTLAGLSVFIALAVDACVDPMVGYISDNTRSRYGRRHPFMMAAVVPIAVMFGLLFSIPAFFHGLGLFAYSTIVLLCMRFGLSCFVVPYMAMGGELSDGYHERSIIVTYRHAFGIVSAIIPVTIALPLFLKGDNYLLREAYVPYAWTCAAIVLVGGLVASFGSLDTVPRLHQVKAGEPPRAILREFGEVLRNRSFVSLFVALLFFFIAQGAAAVIALHAGKFFWRLPNGVIASVQILYPVGMAIGVPLALGLARVFEKRTIVLAGQAIFCAVQATPPLLRIAGLLPPDGPVIWGILIGTWMSLGVIVTALVIGFQSMMADAADEHDYLFGARREGVYFAGLSFATKLTAGAGGFIAGIALDAIGFPSEWISAHPHAPVHLSDAVVRNLGLIAGPLPALITLSCIVATFLYRIDRKRHAEIQAALAARPK